MYIKLHKYCKTMTVDELHKYFPPGMETKVRTKGQNSLGAMESIVKGMFYSKNQSEEFVNFNTIYILTMTDYDPAGYYIAEALEGQVYDILKAIGKTHIKVKTHRIGITPDQLTPEEVRQNMYSPKKANIEKWMERTNGIDGQQKGLELDAFSSSQIREIFVNNLERFIDEEVYKTFVKKAYIKLKALEAIKDRFSEVVESVTEDLIDDVEILDFDIHEIAKRGRSTLNVENLCNDDIDERISELINKNL